MDYSKVLAQAIADAAGLAAEDIASWIEVPADEALGDYAFPCFKLAKTLRKAPPAIAAEIGGKLVKPDFISEVRVVGAYINFFLDRVTLAKQTLEDVFQQGDAYGGSDKGAGRVVCIDYSSINIAKPFHIGHLSTTVIGNALYRIYGFLGYKPVGINHLGDWGTQFGKLIVAYKLWAARRTSRRAPSPRCWSCT